MTTILSLIGEQPIPILLVDRALQPDVHLLAYTERTQRVAENLGNLLPHAKRLRLQNAYDITYLRETFARAYHPTTIFNLTSGTKPMSWAGYDLARQNQADVIYLQSEKKQTLLHRILFSEQGVRQTTEFLPSLLNLEDYLAAHGLKPEAHLHYSNRQEVALGHFLEAHTEQCWGNVKFPAFEIDFLVRRGNQVAVIEAKATKKGKRFAIDQLTTIAGREYLGTYTGRIWAVEKMPGTQLQDLARAYRIEIVVVNIHQPAPGRWRLTPASQKRFRAALDRVLGTSST